MLKKHIRRNIIIVVILLLIFVFFVLVKTKLIVKIVAPRIVNTFSTPNDTAFQYNSPTIVGDFIYIGTSNWVNYPEPEKLLPEFKQNYIYKLDLDFNKIWEFPLATAELTGGGVTLDSKGNLYFVGMVYSVDLGKKDADQGKSGIFVTNYLYSLTNNGEFRWKKQISYSDEVWIHGMLNVAVSADDIIYAIDSKLFAFNSDGDLLWQYPADNRLITGNLSAPIIDSTGNVYFTAPETNSDKQESEIIKAYKFTPTGRMIREALLGNKVFVSAKGDSGGYKNRWNLSTPAFGVNEKRMYAVIGNTINAIDTGTGNILWSYVPQGMTGIFKASPAVDDYDNVYIGTKDNEASVLYAVKADGSGLLWKNPIGGDLYASPMLGEKNILYIGSEYSKYGGFQAVDMKTGKVIWSLPELIIGDHSFGSPALYKGYIYAGIHKQELSGSLFKIRSESFGYLPAAAWPRFHGGNANTGRIK